MKIGFQLNDTFPSRKEVMDKIEQTLKYEPKVETIHVDEALNRIAAEDIFSKLSVPVVRASCLDGVAVKSERFKNGMPDTSKWIKGIDFVRADTGDDFPDEYDAVIRIECVDLKDDGHIEILDEVDIKPGSGIKPAGCTIKEGELLVKKGTPLRAVELSALVMGGVMEIPVYKKPVIAFIPTGDELIAPGEVLSRGKTVDSNSILAKSLLTEFGAEPILYPIVQDDKRALKTALLDAMSKADMVLINGGSSLGSEDYNAKLLEEMGEIVSHGVLAAPGKPVCIGFIDNKPVINIPGPPGAIYYVMDWLVRGIICKMLRIPVATKKTVRALLVEDINTPFNVEILCKMNTIKREDGSYETYQVPFKKSTASATLCSNSAYVTKPGTAGNKAGEYIEVELLVDEAFL